MRHLLFIVCSLLCAAPAVAQLQAVLVTFDYREQPLGSALDDLTARYQVRFSYSPDRLPLDFPLTGSAQREPLEQALTMLFAGTPIQHAVIGEQIALRADGRSLSKLEARPVRIRQESPLYPEENRVEPRPYIAPAQRITQREMPPIGGGDTSWSGGLDANSLEVIARATDAHERRLAAEEWDSKNRLAQVSLLPYLGTNTYRSSEITNNLSVNVLWGTSGGVDGFEIGGIANSVTNDVQGFQMAGGANWVGGNVTGTQFAGLFNYVGGQVRGLQMALGGNITRDSVVGTQIGGFFNWVDADMDGTQVSGMYNVAKGDVGAQYSLLYNQAEAVEKRQVGLLNVCDTTSLGPIGLLSIVRYGYNRLEVGSSEALYVNLSGKIGAYRLYNIFHLGLRWDANPGGNNDLSGNFTTWALGYGFGRADRLGKKVLLNTELVGMHVNEQQVWTNRLNMLTQLRLTLDWQIGRRLSFYGGPVLNAMWSERVNPLTGEVGTQIAPHSWWEERNGNTQFIGWLGFTAGFRI